MKINTKNIIKLLPMDESKRQYLLENFDTMPTEQKSPLVDILWDSYTVLFEAKLKDNIEQELAKTENSTVKIDKDFYKTIRERTEQEMEKEAVSTVEKVDLSEARKAMEMIVNEIKAAKTAKGN